MLSSFSSLDRHMLVHSGERPFSCQFCGQTFTTNGNMHRHQRTHGSKDGENGGVGEAGAAANAVKGGAVATAGGNGGGNACGTKRSRKRESTNSSGLTDDLTPTADRPGEMPISMAPSAVCPLCDKTFGSELGLETHVLAVHPGQQLCCDTCSAAYPTIQALNIHRYLHHFQRLNQTLAAAAAAENKFPIVPPALVPISLPVPLSVAGGGGCIGSPLTKHLEGALTRPLLAKDKDLADVQSILSLTQNFAGLPSNGGSGGVHTSSGGGPPSSVAESIMSDKSNMSESESSSARKRIRLDEDSTSGQEEDEESGRSRRGDRASSSTRMEDGEGSLHEDGDLPEEGVSVLDDDPVIKEMKMKGEFPCSQCPAVFPNLRALKGHNKEHLGKAPYRCNVGTCTYSSNDKSTLTRHMRRHTGEKPFECKVCNFGFTTKANCERHLKNKHRKSGRDQIRNCLLIHETEDTETLISRMQMTGDISVNPRDKTAAAVIRRSSSGLLNHQEEDIDVENDSAFRCKVCKLTFMQKFAVIQHAIHSHPEYAKDVDHIAEAIGGGGASGEASRLSAFDLQQQQRFNTSIDEDAPLDLSKDNIREDEESIDLTGDGEEDNNGAGLLNGSSGPGILPKLPGQFPPPGFPPLLLPGQPSGPPPSMFYPYLAAMPFLLNQQSLISGLQNKNNFYNGGGVVPGPPGKLPPVPPLDLAPLLAAQEFAKKQAEFLQQREAAEALQNLSQAPMKTASVAAAAVVEEKKDDEGETAVNATASPAGQQSVPVLKMTEVGENEEKLDESMYKMVIKNGVLMKKPKQKRYRTERPYSCQSCNAKFTLRSNMERHIKQQHPDCWSGKARGSRKHVFLPTLPTAAENNLAKAMEVAEDTDTEKEDDGLLVIDDKPDRRGGREDDHPADLASVTKLLTTATTQSFPQFMAEAAAAAAASGGEAIPDGDDLKENGDERKSAYSAAPHKIDCPFCYRKFPWTSSLNRHILTHTGQKPYKCQDCALWFTTKSNRDRHQVRKHGAAAGSLDPANSRNVSDRPFKCSQCPASTFSSDENLIRHHYEKHLNMEYQPGVGGGNHTVGGMDVDEEDEDDESLGVVDVKSYFKCHVCTEEFLHRAETIAHIEDVHPETYRENQEVYESASRIPIDVNNYRRDPNDAEQGTTRVNCIFCPCQFRSTVELSKHVLSHTRTKQYNCDICATEFTSRMDYIKHKKTHDSAEIRNHSSSSRNNNNNNNNSNNNDQNQNQHHHHRRSTAEAAAAAAALVIPTPPPKQASAAAALLGNIVTKRANLMDKINKLSLLSAAKAEKTEPAFHHRLFGHPVSSQQTS